MTLSLYAERVVTGIGHLLLLLVAVGWFIGYSLICFSEPARLRIVLKWW